MKDVKNVQELLKSQNGYMRLIIKLQTKLFETQKQIDKHLVQQIQKAEKKDENPDILTNEQVCEMLGISKSTLYRMRK